MSTAKIEEAYTFEDLESYGKRLHVSTVFVLIFNIFTGYIVLKHSTESMGKYKYYILLTVISAALMDLDATLIFGIYPTFPLPGFCGAGLVAKHLNWFWGEVIQYLILQEIFSICGNSLLLCYIYRYCVLKGNVQFFHSFKGITIITIWILLYPIAPTIFLFTTLEDRAVILEYIKESAPNMYDLYKDGPCSCFRVEKSVAFIIITCAHILAISIVSNIFVIKTWKLMSVARNSLSPTTYKMYKEFIIALIIQSSVPAIVILIPSGVIGIAVLLQVQSSKAFASYALQGLFFHSVTNCLCILLIIKIYRKAAIKILLKLVWFYKPQQQSQVHIANTSSGNAAALI